MISEVLPHYLFGIYILEIHSFFEKHFTKGVAWAGNTKPLSMQVAYGTPRAAFRFMIQKFNGKVLLPMMNFYIGDSKRDLTRERVNVYITDPEAYDPVTKTIPISRNPMHFNVTFSVNIWTNDQRERDFILHEILQMFPMGEISLIYYPDPTNKSSYLLMPLKMSESFNDETNIEGLDMKETRDAIKTVFSIESHAIVPYNVYRVPVITDIRVDDEMTVYDGNNFQTVGQTYFSKNAVGP